MSGNELKKCVQELLPKVNENELEEMCPIYWRNETVGWGGGGGG